MIKGFTIAAAALAALLAAATPAQAVRSCNPDGTCYNSNGTSTNGIVLNGLTLNGLKLNSTDTGAPIADVVPTGSGERAVATFAVDAVTLAGGSTIVVR